VSPVGVELPPGQPCWENQLPPEVQPMQPKLPVQDACKIASVETSWAFPGFVTTMGSDADSRALIVGRWIPCGGSTTWRGVTANGVEFGANGRWRLLTADEAGALVPMPLSNAKAVGRYYALASGQIDISYDDFTGGTAIEFISFAGGAGMDGMRLIESDVAGAVPTIFARTTPSPLNGDDNSPSIVDGSCTMLGDWDVPANPVTPVEPAAVLSFDAQGNFVGGPANSNLCAAHTMYGTYRLSPGLFQLTTNVGMGLCHWWFDAGYPAKFDASCTHVTLVQMYDNCTGGRGYLNGTTTLTRRTSGP
jgi:hypothetical protein